MGNKGVMWLAPTSILESWLVGLINSRIMCPTVIHFGIFEKRNNQIDVEITKLTVCFSHDVPQSKWLFLHFLH